MTNTITITDVISGAHHLKAKEPLVLDVSTVGGELVVFCEKLGWGYIDRLVGDGRQSIQNELSFLWSKYAIEDDERLTPRALKLKYELLDIFDVMPVN
jgi:hypothetical protein